MKYEVSGKVKIGSRTLPFTKTFEAKNENRAKDLAYSFFGSKYAIKRSKIEIKEVKEGAKK